MSSAPLAVSNLPLGVPPHQHTLPVSLHFGVRGGLPPVSIADRLTACPLPPSFTLPAVQTLNDTIDLFI